MRLRMLKVDTSFGTSGWAEKAVAHGVVGGVSSVAHGGDFGSGFLAAGVADASAPAISQFGLAGGTAASAIVGGTVSEIAGGDFANGAVTGSFGYLFNYCAHNGCFNRDFTLADAKENFRNGNGAVVTDVGSDELNLSGAGYIAKEEPNVFQVNLSPATDSYYVYGTVTGVLNADGNMSFRPDTYNFDYKNPASGQSIEERSRIVVRNAGTFGGRVYDGSGTPYKIHFSGSQALSPDTINRLRNCEPVNGC